MQKNTLLRVRQFQPSNAPLVTALCGERLRIGRLNAACLFVTSINVSFLCYVFCVEYFSLPHTHSCSTFKINLLFRVGYCLFVGLYFIAMEMKLKFQV